VPGHLRHLLVRQHVGRGAQPIERLRLKFTVAAAVDLDEKAGAVGIVNGGDGRTSGERGITPAPDQGDSHKPPGFMQPSA